MTSARQPVAVDDPADRPWTRRAGARVIIVDEQDRILLFCDSDPGRPGLHWWVTPGGGVDAGETERQAAVREVAEETGLRITEAELIGPLARRRVRHGYSDRVLEQDESFYLVRVAEFTPDTSDFTDKEKLTLLDHRWWTRDELASTTEWIWPRQLPELAELVDRPQAWPWDLGLIDDESTRAIGAER